MDAWQATQNYAIFLPVVALAAWYYWPHQDGAVRSRQQVPIAGTKRKDADARDLKTRSMRAELAEAEPPVKTSPETAPQATKPNPRKRKVNTKPAETTPPAIVQDSGLDEEDEDLNARQFAQQMVQARKGQKLGTPQHKEQRIRSVRQSSVLGTPASASAASESRGDADDETSPLPSPAVRAGDVHDMLEPVAPGPLTLRLTASTKPQKEKVVRQPKAETAETKKQRQNRKKAEERRLQREDEERQRKTLEEKQRRAAREARGEPAKNGMSAAQPPASNPWTAKAAVPASTEAPTPALNGEHQALLLDTFDAESSSSGGLEASTAATSTTEAEPHQPEPALSEEQQVAMALRLSEDESGWTLAATKKQLKKKSASGESAAASPTHSEAGLNKKFGAPVVKPLPHNRPNGFGALEVEGKSHSTNGDARNASSWEP